MHELITIPPRTPIIPEIVDRQDDPREMTLREFYEHYYQPFKLRSGSANTKRLYRQMFNSLYQFARRELLLSELSNDLVGRAMAWFLDRGRKPATANRIHFMLCALWRYACRRGILSHWPESQLVKVPQRVPRGWTTAELKRLFQAIDETPGMIGPIRAAAWWRALHLVLWDTSERIGAIRAAEWAWLSLSEPRTLTVPAEVRKGGRTDRVYPLHPETVDALRRISAPARKLIFEWPFSATHIYHHQRRILKRAGLPSGPEFRFHCMRKTVASFSKVAGLDPSDVLDHTDGRVTRKYLDPRICGGKSLPDTLFRPDIKEGN